MSPVGDSNRKFTQPMLGSAESKKQVVFPHQRVETPGSFSTAACLTLFLHTLGIVEFGPHEIEE
jgi:hypothetical protein